MDDRGINPVITGICLSAVTALVFLGGRSNIRFFSGRIVPFMASFYLFNGLAILLQYSDSIYASLELIFNSAFSGHAAQGGFAGATIWTAVRLGISVGVFSNESGLGTASFAHGDVSSSSSVRQGFIAMLGNFIDSMILCTITGLAIIASGVWDSGETGSDLVVMAFSLADDVSIGGLVIVISVLIFGFTTMLGWSHYGEMCWSYLFGKRFIFLYRVLFVATAFLGPLWLFYFGAENNRMGVESVWMFSMVILGIMTIPNLISLAILAPKVGNLSRQYFSKKQRSWRKRVE